MKESNQTPEKFIQILPFRSENQDVVQALILAGLVEHWGFLDESKNPDLNDIAASYQGGVFLVAWCDGQVVGTGAYVPRSNTTVEVVRMSVARHMRRQGIGKQILIKLCGCIVDQGFQRIILETTETWDKTIAFYLAFGFEITHVKDGDIYFVLDLQDMK